MYRYNVTRFNYSTDFQILGVKSFGTKSPKIDVQDFNKKLLYESPYH